MSQDTKPSPQTAGSADFAGALCLRWVFPDAAFTPLLDGPRTLGRDEGCDTVLVGHETSRKHAETKPEPPVASIRDLSSRNGVFVNGRRVTSARIGFGDVVRLGEWVGVVVMGSRDDRFGPIISGWKGGKTLRAAVEPARKAAATDLPIIVEGETGTGKEGLATAVHAWSGRNGPLLAVNCAALTPTLAEGELFGYRKGAFTGADRASPGHFRAAHGGTLMLDEVLDLPLSLQAKLLRVLEQRQVHPLGESFPVPIDVRLVVASQEPLARAVEQGRFRADLLARIDGVSIALPPLRERREDIVPLFREFLAEQGGGSAPALDPKLVEQLLRYDWPLNVRELRMLARRLMVLHGHDSLLERQVLPARIVEAGGAPASAKPVMLRAATDDESAFEALVGALRTHRGNVSRAAAAIGISRARAYRLLDARPDFAHADLRARDTRDGADDQAIDQSVEHRRR